MQKNHLKYIVLILLLTVHNTYLIGQETLNLKGLIVGVHQKPVSGVSVSIEGSAEPAITNEKGEFSILSPSKFVWILIAPVEGYKPQRVFLNNRVYLYVQLTPNDINSGYDEIIDLDKTTKRRDLVSSFYAPDPNKNIHFPYQSVDQSFQGRVPGMLSVGFSGMPGRGNASFLRGIKSMNTNSQPLYVIDGIPLESPGLYQSQLDGYSYNTLSSLDPLDITNITILKDYSSIASYGSRASNGVILIETLKPSEIRTAIDFSMRTGFASSPEFIPQMNSDQYRMFANEILNSSGRLEETFQESYPGLYADSNTPDFYKYNHNTNWQNEVFRNATLNDVYLRVRGGDEIAKYGLAVGYMNQKGVIKETDYERVNIRFVGAFNIFQWLRMNVSNNLVINNSLLKESARVSQTSPILTSLFKAPFLLPFSFDDDGNQLTQLADVESLGISNPAAVINNFSAVNNNYRILTSIKIEGSISNSTKINSVIGANFNSINETIFMPNHGMDNYYDDEAFNAMKSLKDHFFAVYNDNYISWSPELNGMHQLYSSAGLRINMNNFESDWGIAKNSHENDEYRSLQDGIAYLREMGGLNSKWNRMSSYLNINYSFRDKYQFTGTFSADASSRTGRNAPGVLRVFNAPFGLFYSTGLAWRISDEAFLENFHLIEDLKWRITYGRTGNDDIGNYSSLDYFRLIPYRETSGMTPTPVSNTSLKFETSDQWNTGFDLSLRGNRVNVSVDLFSIKTKDMLIFERLPFYLGESFLPVNGGVLQNKGIEASASTHLIYKENFKWNVGFNFAKIDNRLIKITDDEIITSFEGGEYISREGESMLSFYGYIFDGVISDADEALALNLKTEKGMGFGAGDARFKDISGPAGAPDGIINEFDKTLLGSPIPDFYGGFNSNFIYKRWSLDLSFQFVTGNKVFNYLRYQNEKMTDLSNQSTSVLNRWNYNGQETMIPRAVWSDPTGNSAFSTRWIEDGSYFRLKSLTLAYKIPKKFLLFKNAEFYITGTNLITISRYLGYDPEFNYSYNATEMGIDYGLTPFTKRILIGINMGL